MKNRIDKLFEGKAAGVLNIYCTAGFPHFDSTTKVLLALQQHGADMVEIGMPYSDPLADGPVIQESNKHALENGMSISALFDQLKGIRELIHLPIVLMGYLNPVLQYGMERFCTEAASAGVDGVILPDLPMREFESGYKALFEKYGLHFIFLITPETTEERIRKADALSKGFLYAVSASSTTGNTGHATGTGEQEKKTAYLRKLQAMKLRNPILVGFGINDRNGFEEASRYTAGAVMGSAYIRAIREQEDVDQTTKKFLNALVG